MAAAIKFPSALFGMFCIFSILIVLDATVPAVATSLMNFFQPALLFIQRWLPLFYVPSLVVLPLSVKSIPPASGIKICYIIGMQVKMTFFDDACYTSLEFSMVIVSFGCYVNGSITWAPNANLAR